MSLFRANKLCRSISTDIKNYSCLSLPLSFSLPLPLSLQIFYRNNVTYDVPGFTMCYGQKKNEFQVSRLYLIFWSDPNTFG